MATISKIKEIRKDGKMIDESLTLTKLIQMGWLPSKIIEIKWEFDGKTISLKSDYGFLNRVTDDRQHLAVMEDIDPTGAVCEFRIYDGHGKLQRIIPNQIPLRNNERTGMFRNFRPPQVKTPTALGAVFDADADPTGTLTDGGAWQVDIDSGTGVISNVRETR